MTVSKGDILYLKSYLGKGTKDSVVSSYLIISQNEYEDARKLSKKEKISINEIFGLKETDRYIVEGSPLYLAISNGKSNTWVPVPLFTKVNNEPHSNYYFIQRIIRKQPLAYELIMKRVDEKWSIYSNKEDNLVDDSIAALGENYLLTVAYHINKNEYIMAIKLIHTLFNGWSYLRILNTIREIQKRKLSKTYGYLNIVKDES